MSNIFHVAADRGELTNQTIQRAVDACAAAGGGAVEVPVGVYRLQDSVHLRSGVRLIGEKGTVLLKQPSISSPIADFLGYGFHEFTVQDPELFEVGQGVYLTDKNSFGFYATVATIIDRQGDSFYVDRPFNHDYLPASEATASTLFPLISAVGVRDAAVSALQLDGNPLETRVINGCRGGGVFLLGSSNVRLEDVEVRHFKGDAISFQQCTDITVQSCRLHHNSGSGLHPGSGSVRYVFAGNHIHDNEGFGIFYCLRTTHSRCEGNRIESNGEAGISIGERDTDHWIRANEIRDNVGVGVSFREVFVRGGDRVCLEGNKIRGNRGGAVRITGRVRQIQIIRNEIEAGNGPVLEVGPDTAEVWFAENLVEGREQQSTDCIGNVEAVSRELPAQLLEAGPQALSHDGGRHLGLAELPGWIG